MELEELQIALSELCRASRRSKAPVSGAQREIYDGLKELVVHFPYSNELSEKHEPVLRPLLQLFGENGDSSDVRVKALLERSINSAIPRERTKWKKILTEKAYFTRRVGLKSTERNLTAETVHDFACLVTKVLGAELDEKPAGAPKQNFRPQQLDPDHQRWYVSICRAAVSLSDSISFGIDWFPDPYARLDPGNEQPYSDRASLPDLRHVVLYDYLSFRALIRSLEAEGIIWVGWSGTYSPDVHAAVETVAQCLEGTGINHVDGVLRGVRSVDRSHFERVLEQAPSFCERWFRDSSPDRVKLRNAAVYASALAVHFSPLEEPLPGMLWIHRERVIQFLAEKYDIRLYEPFPAVAKSLIEPFVSDSELQVAYEHFQAEKKKDEELLMELNEYNIHIKEGEPPPLYRLGS